MSEHIVELDSKHSIALKIAFAEEMRGGDFCSFGKPREKDGGEER